MVLLLVVAGVGVLPDGRLHVLDSEVDCADSDEGLEFPTHLLRHATPTRDELGPPRDFMIGYRMNVPPTEPLSEVRPRCVFEATVRSVDEEDRRVAHVLVHEHDGRKTKAVVQGDRGEWRGVDDPVGESVRFSCASKSEKDKTMPVYEDCRQSSGPYDDGRCADPAGCARSLDGSRSAFRPAYASDRSSASRDPKDGCVRATSPSGDCVGFCFNAFVKSVDSAVKRSYFQSTILEKLAYVMANPVKAGLVRHARESPGITVLPPTGATNARVTLSRTSCRLCLGGGAMRRAMGCGLL